MPEFRGPDAQSRQYNGTHGNASRTAVSCTVAAVTVNDTLIFATFDAGTSIDEIRLNHAALGAGATMDLGFEYIDDTPGSNPAAFGAAHAVASAGVKIWNGEPVLLAARARLVGTIKAGTGLAGKITAVVDYRFIGVSHAL